ncbi:hypothetical protein ACP4OV_007996 [Aristida adscensionis]
MAFAIKASSPSIPASSSPAPSPPRAPRRAAAAVAMTTPGRRRAVAAVRAVATAPPPAPAPSRRAGGGGERCLPVSQTLSKAQGQGQVSMQTAFIPYLTAGDPDMATTAEALRLLDACGADVIELGVPFSDPYADGPVIQASAARALAGGATPARVLAMLKEVTPELSCPVVLLSYFGPVVRRGPAHFAAAVKEAGVHGLIVPDLPYVATCAMGTAAMKNNLELVLLTTPATPAERMKEITKASEGFVYLVTDKPVAVGFGISTPEHVKQIAKWGADGVIIGSAMVRQLGEAASPKEGLKSLEKYGRSMKNALP